MPERTLDFTGADTLLVSLNSPDGTPLVVNGFGNMDPEVNDPVITEFGYRPLMGKGMVLNGKPEGKWVVRFVFDKMYSFDWFVEKWANGKRVSRKVITENYNMGLAQTRRPKRPSKHAYGPNRYPYRPSSIPYTPPAKLSLFCAPLCTHLEEFRVEICSDPTAVPTLR